LNFLVLCVVMVVEFIIKFFRDYKHNIVPSLEKFKNHLHFLLFFKKEGIPRPFYYRIRRMPASLRLRDERSTTGSKLIYSPACTRSSGKRTR